MPKNRGFPQELDSGSFSPKQLKDIYRTLEQLRSLPLYVASTSPEGEELFGPGLTPASGQGANCAQFWAIDSLQPFSSTHSVEDEKTRTLTTLNQLKIHAQAHRQTHLILFQTDDIPLQDILRPETLQIPDLLLYLHVQAKDGQKTYRLYSERNALSDPFELFFSYNEKRRKFEDIDPR